MSFRAPADGPEVPVIDPGQVYAADPVKPVTLEDILAQPAGAPKGIPAAVYGILAKVDPLALVRGLPEAVAATDAPGVQERGGIGEAKLNVRHDAIQQIWVYDKLGRCRNIPITNLGAVAGQLTPYCPVCGTLHPSVDLNACPKAARVAYTVCPYCERKIWDAGDELPSGVEPAVRDENFVSVDMPDTADARQRLKTRLYTHLAVFHRQQAIANGIPVDRYGEFM